MSTQHDEIDVARDEQAAPPPDSAFLNLLQYHRHGNLLTDLSKAVRECVEACQAQGKPAGLTLKIAVKPAGNGSGAVVVADKLAVKLPEETPVTSFFFSDDHGNLHRNDPRQKELPLQVVKSAPVEAMPLRRAAAN
jgi:hypothetical protein